MKKVLSLLAAFGVMFYLSSCGDDDDPVADNGVTITGIPATATIDNLGTYTGTVTLEAKDGLAALAVTKGTAAFAAETYTGETSATWAFSYTAVEADEDSNITFTFTATDADGDTEVFTHVLSVGEAPVVPTTVEVSANITEDVTWETGKTYILQSRIIVEPGAALTIQPGVVVKGEVGDGANATALIVARGAQIFAEGTAESPIIFTSVADEIQPGEIKSPNLTETNSGLWGGLIILGAAPISDSGNDGTEQIEGIPGDVALAEYGGDVADDNSGVLKYVSIRHGGTRLGDGDEINGLTLGGVGSGTVIENIEVVANLDDGVEWFGGTVNVTNVLVWAADDDAIDIDQAYAGTIDNAIVIAFDGTDHGLEVDGPEGTATGSFNLKNITVKGGEMEIADFRDEATGTVTGAYFFNFVSPATDINGSDEGGTGEGDLSLSTGTTTSTVDFSNLQITLAADAVLADVFHHFTAQEITDKVTTVDAGANTVGADATVFGWTFASAMEALADF